LVNMEACMVNNQQELNEAFEIWFEMKISVTKRTYAALLYKWIKALPMLFYKCCNTF
jgi:hypothetical protein